MPEGGDTEAGAGVAGGSLIGMLVGVLGGPVGMLLSGSAGAASGALYDADRLDKGDEAIEQLGALMPTGGNALLAETVEDTTEPLDAFVSEMGGTIVRRPLDEVVAELDGVGLCRKHRAQPRGTREERNLPVTGSGDPGRQPLRVAPAAGMAGHRSRLEKGSAGPGSGS